MLPGTVPGSLPNVVNPGAPSTIYPNGTYTSPSTGASLASPTPNLPNTPNLPGTPNLYTPPLTGTPPVAGAPGTAIPNPGSGVAGTSVPTIPGNPGVNGMQNAGCPTSQPNCVTGGIR